MPQRFKFSRNILLVLIFSLISRESDVRGQAGNCADDTIRRNIREFIRFIRNYSRRPKVVPG